MFLTKSSKAQQDIWYQQLSHPNHSYTLETAKKYDWEAHGSGGSARTMLSAKPSRTEQQMKRLFRLIRYVFDTKNTKLIMSPKSSLTSAWEIVAFCDSNCAGN
jgi:hypothetical protein